MFQVRNSESMAGRVRSRRVRFWIRRYLPPEIVGIITMLASAQLTAGITASIPIITLAALVGGTLGFTFVLGVTEYREQWVLWGMDARPGASTVVRITLRLLRVELGAARLVDFAILRPVLLFGGILLVGNVPVGLTVGTVAADGIFYAATVIVSTTSTRRGLREIPAGPRTS